MIIQITDNGYYLHAELLTKCLAERVPVEKGKQGMHILLDICKGDLVPESYQILQESNIWKITGADERGLYYGIGKFLHSAKWEAEYFVPNPPTEVIAPNSSFRAMYFAVHFNNWYDEAPTDELEKYLEELLLYGYNTIVCIIPIVSINSFEDDFFVRSIEKIRSIFSLAKKCGMDVGILDVPNQGKMNAPVEWNADSSYEQNPQKRVRGDLGRNICPSIPEAFDYLRSIWLQQLEQFHDIGLDYVISWPYDEGGCGCDDCRPWGANGYCKLVKALYQDAKSMYPEMKFIVSTWLYDTPESEGEFEGLYQRLKTDLDFVDYILVDSHTDFPNYPLEHEVVKPIVNFPEISMWRLVPWGGRGANPLPKRFQKIWDSSKHVLSGGMPYSEGMYEDILKIQCVGYYWDAEKSYREILGEYINYEYTSHMIEEVLEMMELIEYNHVRVAEYLPPEMESVYRTEELAERVNECMDLRRKNSWRWRILYIRAKMDRIVNELCMKKFGGDREAVRLSKYNPTEWLEECEEVQELMQELCKWYHCVNLREDKRNAPTLPSVKRGIVKV